MKFPLLFIIIGLFICINSFAQKIPNDSAAFNGTTQVELLGEGIKITPPAHFRQMKTMASFMHIGSSSSMQIKEIQNTPWQIVVNSLTEEYFEKQGVRLLAKDTVSTKVGNPGMMYLISFDIKNQETQKEVTFERIMYFTGDYNRTIWINANYPALIRQMMFPVLEECILSLIIE
jgi:hypothetical protein